MSNAPIVSWYEGTNAKENEVKTTVNFGTVDSDSQSETKTFYIWNNRAGTDDCSKMEEVTYTTRDRNGGIGDSVGNIVEAVRDNWFNVRVDTLNETSFIPVGKGGIAQNQIGTKDLGTNGTTTNVNSPTATDWTASKALTLGIYVKPNVANGYIYKVTNAGTTGATQPTWSKVETDKVTDGTVEYEVVQIEKKPQVKEILGFANTTKADGSDANLAGGNFVQISVYADVPITASAGKNLLVQRVKVA